MGRIVWSFEGNNDSMTLSNTDGTDFMKEAGSHGMGVANTELKMIEGAGSGAKWRRTRRGTRNIVFPVLFFGDTADIIEDKQDRLLAIMDDTYMEPKLVATYPDGTQWETPFHYASGADSPIGTDSNGRNWARWPLTIVSPDSYFTSRDAVSFSLRAGSSGRGLIRTGGGLSRLRLSSSQALGTLNVNNTGHVDAYPIWTVKGPGDGFVATRLIDGAKFDYDAPILSSETITFNTKTGEVTDQTGASRYISLATAPKLFSIPKGSSQISALLSNATGDSLVTMYFQPRREFLFG